jgi:hypothetical protein
MGALTRLDISKNKLFHDDGTAAGKILGDMLAVNSTIQELDVSGNAVECIDSRGGPSFAQALSVGISDNGALLHFDISNNDIRAEGGKALVEALKCNQVINMLSIAENNLSFNSSGDQDMSALVALADVIPGMRALTKFDISKNKIRAEGGKALAVGLKGNQVIIEFNIANNELRWDANVDDDMSGIIALADVIRDNGALRRLHIGQNNLEMESKRLLLLAAPLAVEWVGLDD